MKPTPDRRPAAPAAAPSASYHANGTPTGLERKESGAMLLYALSLLAIREHGGGMDVQHRAVAAIAPNEAAAHDLGLQIAQRDYPTEAGWTYDVRLLEI